MEGWHAVVFSYVACDELVLHLTRSLTSRLLASTAACDSCFCRIPVGPNNFKSFQTICMIHLQYEKLVWRQRMPKMQSGNAVLPLKGFTILHTTDSAARATRMS
jgi:hypothetical protein